jgi:hypothetical protein
LSGCDLTNANFKRANLVSANLEGAELAGADFQGADLSDANLHTDSLYGSLHVDEADWNANTIWPDPDFFVVPPAVEDLKISDASSSDAFRRWFGNSVVRDATGAPVVVYHGTRNGGFTVFDPAKTDEHQPGFFFSNDVRVANSYGGAGRRVVDPALHPTSRGEVAGVYRLYLKLEHPFVHDAQGANWNRLNVPEFPAARRTYDVGHAAKAAGYDGVVLKNLVDSGGTAPFRGLSDVYIVFDPRNIKSATANVGTYDPNDPDIRRNPRSAASGRSTRSSRKRR